MNPAFEITFLGTGTSTGIPMIGCDCPVCRSEDPHNKRTRSAIHLRTPDRSLLVDAGPDIRLQLLREKISELDAVLISHAHTDHIMGFDDLRRFSLGAENRLPVYATPPSMAALKHIFNFAFSGENNYYSYLKPDPHEISGAFSIGATSVTPLPVLHGSVDTIGFLFAADAGSRRAAYIPDCKTIPSGTEALMRDLDVVIIDALRFSPHPTHMNFEEALEFSSMIGAKEVWFTHIACEVDHGKAEEGLPDHVRVAYDGLKLQV